MSDNLAPASAAESPFSMVRISPGILARMHWKLLRAAAFTARFGKLYAAIYCISKLFSKFHFMDVSVFGRMQLRLRLDDPYWMFYIVANQMVEPEIAQLISILPQVDTLFIDCGANLGWWSLVGEKVFGFNCIAVEAAPEVAQELEANLRRNGAKTKVVRAAVWDSPDQTMRFLTGKEAHAAGHLEASAGFVSPRRLPITHDVITTTIDDLLLTGLKGFALDSPQIVVKLDVEGAEARCFSGARVALDAGAIIIYEDHGKDLAHAATAAALQLGLAVYALSDAGPVALIKRLADVAQFKPNRHLGYNFAACRPETKMNEFIRNTVGTPRRDGVQRDGDDRHDNPVLYEVGAKYGPGVP